MAHPRVLITGASGFIGGAIAERLAGRADVRSLTSHPAKNRFGDRVRSFPYDFDRPERMADAFSGVEVFVNSYYVRFNYGTATFERAVEQTRSLVARAREAGVRKIVHVSVSNADERSDLPYYCNKGRIERLVRECGLDHTILRPAIVVGPGDILLNNIAFFLRRLPVFTIFGGGKYRVQPMTVEAFADVAVEAVDGGHRNVTLPVAGPSDWVFLDMVRAVRAAVGSRALIVPAPAAIALAGLRVAGLLLGDVVLTSDEVKGLTREYLYAADPVRRGLDFGSWVEQPTVASMLGRRYEGELARHFRPAR
uniref:NAD-dependent epimerase/dehydratase n=1 Tax=uncultured bacterium 213 TaxID=698383 RepID=E3T6X4_9BACT|nr:NAD-dependent epimerase/dehydratase [uncultured bacterium 213]